MSNENKAIIIAISKASITAVALFITIYLAIFGYTDIPIVHDNKVVFCVIAGILFYRLCRQFKEGRKLWVK